MDETININTLCKYDFKSILFKSRKLVYRNFILQWIAKNDIIYSNNLPFLGKISDN